MSRALAGRAAVFIAFRAAVSIAAIDVGTFIDEAAAGDPLPLVESVFSSSEHPANALHGPNQAEQDAAGQPLDWSLSCIHNLVIAVPALSRWAKSRISLGCCRIAVPHRQAKTRLPADALLRRGQVGGSRLLTSGVSGLPFREEKPSRKRPARRAWTTRFLRFLDVVGYQHPRKAEQGVDGKRRGRLLLDRSLGAALP